MGKLYLLLIVLSISIPLFLFHIYWFLGGNFGLNFTNYLKFKKNKKSKSIKRINVFIMTLLLAAVVLVNIFQTGIYFEFESQGLIFWANRIIAVGFLYRAIGNFRYFGFTKTFKKGTFSTLDSWIYSPLFVVVAICQFWLTVLD